MSQDMYPVFSDLDRQLLKLILVVSVIAAIVFGVVRSSLPGALVAGLIMLLGSAGGIALGERVARASSPAALRFAKMTGWIFGTALIAGVLWFLS